MSPADPHSYPRLAGHVLLRRLEGPRAYDRLADELYELDPTGFAALSLCDGGRTLAEVGLDPEFLETCLDEGLLELLAAPDPRAISAPTAPLPSLRYLELQVTWRCNLSCAHCYLGRPRAVDLPLDQIRAALTEFDQMGGLRVLISGGEPLMHPRWAEVNQLLADTPQRRVLLSNGLRLDERTLAELAVDEVQISLDGLKKGHEALRGPGSYDAALAAAQRVRRAGLDLSVATMAHGANLDELEGLARVVQGLGAMEWGIDAPCPAGNLMAAPELMITPAQGAKAMSLGFGGAYHGGRGEMACGLHLCTVGADGQVAQCGFYLDQPLGHISRGLAAAWLRRTPLRLEELAICNQCPAGTECGGGCRFRAPGRYEPDPVMCALYGVEPKSKETDGE